MYSNAPPLRCDVAVIGGGPSGLAIATELKNLGIASVVVLEREAEAGGIPRHCGHSPFGMREFKRIYSGSRYARQLVSHARRAAVILCLNTSVTSIESGGILQLSTPQGMHTLEASRVVIATGIRETPRATRLISGQRPMGIVTTGALQSMIYLQNKVPFKRPLIVGSELVAFSALLSCRHAGVRPVAMLEKNACISARTGFQSLARVLGVPIHINTQLLEIVGKQRVSGAKICPANGPETSLECDGLVFTGQFVAESSLMRMSHLRVDPLTGNPVTDQFGRCSDPVYFAVGNMTHPVETAGHCWSDGVRTAPYVYASLSGMLNRHDRRIAILPDHPNIKYLVPQQLSLPGGSISSHGLSKIQMRFHAPARGRVSIHAGSLELGAKSIHALPDRRFELAMPELPQPFSEDALEIRFKEI